MQFRSLDECNPSESSTARCQVLISMLLPTQYKSVAGLMVLRVLGPMIVLLWVSFPSTLGLVHLLVVMR